jgi:hypothetical protein
LFAQNNEGFSVDTETLVWYGYEIKPLSLRRKKQLENNSGQSAENNTGRPNWD